MRRDWEAALASLCALDDILIEHYGEDDRHVETVRWLMGKVNYQVLKYPSPFACFECNVSDEEDVESEIPQWKPKKPNNGSKMSGHRVTYA